MGLYEEMAEFRAMINRISKRLEEIDSNAARIPQTQTENLARRFAALDSSLEATAQSLSKARGALEQLKAKWSRR